MTEEQRIEAIKNAVLNSKGFKPNSEVMELVGELQAEAFVLNNGLRKVEEEDVSDEAQYLLKDRAEEIDEEDQEIGLSDEMKGVYDDS